MTPLQTEMAADLMDIEYQLRHLRLWSSEPPSPQALASEQPFAIDTLTFQQWLQFVFLPRMRALLANGQALPQRCALAPMGEQVFGSGEVFAPLLTALRNFDRYFD